jgi:hypothetical protein
MQTVTYNVDVPIVGQHVLIRGVPQEYEVYNIESTRPPYDSVLIKQLNGDLVSRLVITNGKWQVQGYNHPHQVMFYEPKQGLVRIFPPFPVEHHSTLEIGDLIYPEQTNDLPYLANPTNVNTTHRIFLQTEIPNNLTPILPQVTTPQINTLPQVTRSPTIPTLPQMTTPQINTLPQVTRSPTIPTLPQMTRSPTVPTLPTIPTLSTIPTLPQITRSPTIPTLHQMTTPQINTLHIVPTLPQMTRSPAVPTLPQVNRSPTIPTSPQMIRSPQINTQILPQINTQTLPRTNYTEITGQSMGLPFSVKEGDIGYYITGNGTKQYDRFVISSILPQKKVTVEFDQPILLDGEIGLQATKHRTLIYRNGYWKFLGKKTPEDAKIVMGENARRYY